ncbi:hypothetical protein Tco_0635230 [Tanacetum coccineum]
MAPATRITSTSNNVDIVDEATRRYLDEALAGIRQTMQEMMIMHNQRRNQGQNQQFTRMTNVEFPKFLGDDVKGCIFIECTLILIRSQDTGKNGLIPTTLKPLRGFLGANLNAFKMDSEAQLSFEALKKAMMEAPVLGLPDFNKPFVICEDAYRGRITTPTQMKWLPKLMGYDYEVEYKKGSENDAADALSRLESSNKALRMRKEKLHTLPENLLARQLQAATK